MFRDLSPLAELTPEICGDFDLRIDRAGVWHYRGSPIGRPALVKLFARVLRREADGSYWLVTPVERGRVTVDDAPFVAIDVAFAQTETGPRATFTTNLGESIAAGPAHKIRTVPQSDGSIVPYIDVRAGLEARIDRAAFYRLIDGATVEDGRLGVRSDGMFFDLGAADLEVGA
jgi:uncharacterized protein